MKYSLETIKGWTDDEKRIKLAELDGWETAQGCFDEYGRLQLAVYFAPNSEDGQLALPNYLDPISGYGLIRELELKAIDIGRVKYCKAMWELLGAPEAAPYLWATAPLEIRVIAVLYVLLNQEEK